MPKAERPDEIKMLDELIYQYYTILRSDDKKSVTLGDLMKMIELKRKLAPTGANQGEFWKMINEIRRGTSARKDGAKRGSSPKRDSTHGRKTT